MSAPKGPTPPVAITPLVRRVEDLYRQLDAPETAPRPKPTGFAKLDWLLYGGLCPGEVAFLGANSSAGKTAFALQMGLGWAERGDAVFFVSQEMPELALAERVVAQATGVPGGALRQRAVSAEQAKRVLALITRWQRLPFYQTDQARSIDLILDCLLAWPFAERPALLVLDYLQLTDAPVGVQGWAQIDVVAKLLKRICVSAGMAALVLSSVTQSAGAAFDEEVTEYSLYGGRGLSFHADFVWLLHRKSGARAAKLRVGKGRSTRTGEVNLEFDETVLTFTEALG